MDASFDLSQPFRPKLKGLDWVGRRVGYIATFVLKEHYRIARVKIWPIGYAKFLLGELIPKYKYVRFEFLKVILALNLNGYFRNIKGNGLLIIIILLSDLYKYCFYLLYLCLKF